MKKKHIIRIVVFAVVSVLAISFLNSFLSVPQGQGCDRNLCFPQRAGGQY